MARPYVVEVSAVDGGNGGNGGNGGDAKPFGDCYQRGVGAAQPPVGVGEIHEYAGLTPVAL
jgi:hypothetical protein